MSGGQVVVQIITNGVLTTAIFAAGSVAGIRAALQGGDDSIQNLTALPLMADGGAGNDTIVGGWGDDNIVGGAAMLKWLITETT